MNQVPMFPLSIVPFPGEQVNLHIFEERYKQLILDCHTENKNFGIIPYIKDMLMDYGVEMNLTKIHKVYPNGEMDIRSEGLRVFRVIEFFKEAKSKLYPGAIVDYADNIEDEDYGKRILLWDLLQELFDVLNVRRKFNKKPTDISTFEIGHHVALPLDEEYKMLLLEKESERQDFLILHLKKIIPTLQNLEVSKTKIKMNGHFRNLKPPRL
ncbi:LON peptidase substrate-binding domain-containing protein [Hyphobacterium sp. CCMP332]|nr:LON peptidase substrate-binding domain-containing protein [Hyphobacterium sp. CCMP332]